MLPCISPVLDEITLHELVFLRIDRVADMSSITHRNLLIPFLITHHLLSAERIETGNGNIEVRKCHSQTGVTHILRKVGSSAERQTDT